MDIDPKLKARFSKKPEKSRFLHSPDHVLADELSKKLNEPKRFGFYLKLATTNDHGILRRIAGFVQEGQAKNPGALFAYLLKKEKDELKNRKISE
jgi:hypothetical protein